MYNTIPADVVMRNSIRFVFAPFALLLCVGLQPAASQGRTSPPAPPGSLNVMQVPPSDLPPNTAVADLRDGDACVHLFAGMGAGPELSVHTAGRGHNAKTHFYFHGSEVTVFPRPVEVSIILFADCRKTDSAVSFAWPEFSRHLRFVYHWNFDPSHSREVEPTDLTTQDSIWKEDSSSKQLWFTLPAVGVPIQTLLTVEVFTGDRLLTTFTLHL